MVREGLRRIRSPEADVIQAKAEAAVQAKMREVTGGLPLPPGLKLF